MADKRPFSREHDEDLDAQSQRSRQRLNLQNSVRDAMKWSSPNDLVSTIEPLFRQLVQEELEKALFQRRLDYQTQRFSEGGLKLQFVGKIKEPIYTENKIEAEDGLPLRVELVESNSGKLVTSSSIKVEIVALKGDFKFDDHQMWSKEQFDEGLARERQGRKPLLVGNLTIRLENGIAIIENICFTDNSSRTPSRKFRIAAKAICRESCGARIKEAISEAFVVKEQRGESYQKQYPPRLSTEIWRLKKISKDGKRCKRLADHEIFTVKEFLQQLAKSPSWLRSIIGKLSDRDWDKIINHAKTCTIDDTNLYEYSAGKTKLFFDCIDNLKGATFDGKTYLSPEKFDSVQKVLVERLKQLTYNSSCRLLTAEELVGVTSLLMNQQTEPLVGPSLYMQRTEFPANQRDGQATQGFNGASTSTTSYAFQEEGINQLGGTSTEHSANPSQEFSSTRMNSFGMSDALEAYIGDNIFFPSSSQGPILPRDHLTAGDIPYAHISALSPEYTTWDHGNGISFPINQGEAGICPILPRVNVHISSGGRPSIGWFKIWAAVKWGISFRKKIARKNGAPRLFPAGLRASVVQ